MDLIFYKDNKVYNISATRIIEFDAAHRVIGHANKCKFFHGHRYKAEFTLSSNELNSLGMVIDFGTIKTILGDWIMENLDHNAILNKEDEELINSVNTLVSQNVYIMTNNPTAENIANHLLSEVCPKLLGHTNAVCTSIKLWETPNCYAIASMRV